MAGSMDLQTAAAYSFRTSGVFEEIVGVDEKRVPRRLAAILAADVAGYTRLMGENEEGTLAALTAHLSELVEPCISDHRGRVVKTTGDGVLAEFASVIDAVRCATEIQKGMQLRNAAAKADQRIDFRIGVNLGDILVQDDDVYGDGVNIAARLEQIAEPGGICLSEEVARQVRGKIDATIADGGMQALKNVSGRVHVFRIAPPGRAVRKPGSRVGRRYALAGAALFLTLVVAAAGWFALRPTGSPDETPPVARRSFPVIAVLPFANQTGDKTQDYLADGITDELIASIGRFHSLRVIGRSAVLPYKGQAIPRAEIVTALGANYFVEGSVRRDERRVRVSARLTDAGNGTVLWTNSYDGAMKDLLDFQETIARETAGKLAVNINEIELRRRAAEPRPAPDAYELVLRARAIGLGKSRRENREIRELAAKAIEKDPGYAAAHALLSEAILARIILGWSEFASGELARGEALARRAIAIAPDEPDGYRALGRYLGLRGEYSEAIKALRRAIEINPSDTAAIAVSGTVRSYDGDLDGAIGALERAVRLNPALDAVYVFDLSACYYLTGRYEDAYRAVLQGNARYPSFAMFDVIGAAAAGRLGRTSEAAGFAQKIRSRMPNLDFRDIGSRYRNPAFGDEIRKGLALAGIKIDRHAAPARTR